MDSTRAATLNVLAQAAVDSAIPVDPIEGVDGGLTVRAVPHRTAYSSFANDGVSARSRLAQNRAIRSRAQGLACAPRDPQEEDRTKRKSKPQQQS